MYSQHNLWSFPGERTQTLWGRWHGSEERAFLQCRRARLGKRKGWFFIKNCCWISKWERNKGSHTLQVYAHFHQTCRYREGRSQLQAPMKDGDFEATLGHLKGQTPEREVTVSVNPEWNCPVCPVLALALQVSYSALLEGLHFLSRSN